MRILVTGASGQLGYDICAKLHNSKIDYLGTDRKSLDITNKDDVYKTIYNYKPTVIIHCAAYTAVDKAEDEKELCYNVNVKGTEYIAKAANNLNAKMAYISTDYIFDGKKNGYYDVSDIPNPLNHYGKTKLEGENIVKQLVDKYFIIRTSWVFGINGNNFIKTMLKLGKKQDSIDVVSDQIGCPTYTHDLAELVIGMVQTDKYGIYNATNEEECAWAEFADFIFKIANMNIHINNISTEEYPTKAVRPKNSRLDKTCLDKAGFNRLPTWQNAVVRYTNSLKAANLY